MSQSLYFCHITPFKKYILLNCPLYQRMWVSWKGGKRSLPFPATSFSQVGGCQAQRERGATIPGGGVNPGSVHTLFPPGAQEEECVHWDSMTPGTAPLFYCTFAEVPLLGSFKAKERGAHVNIMGITSLALAFPGRGQSLSWCCGNIQAPSHGLASLCQMCPTPNLLASPHL